MVDYHALKAADTRVNVVDPAQAVPAIKALRDAVTVVVAAKDIRSVLWRTFEYGKLDLLYTAGQRGDFSLYPAVPGMTAAAIFAAISTTLSFLNSGTEIGVDATGSADWQALLAQVGALTAATVFAPDTASVIAALREQSQPTIAEDFNADDVVAARNYV